MSDKYKSSKDVPLQVIIIRLNELSDSIIAGKDVSEREFTMRIPAECDRDADLVLAEAANRLTELEQWKKQAQDRLRIDLDKNLELEQENQRLNEERDILFKAHSQEMVKADKLDIENQRLRVALLEAMEWNWLDDDAPPRFDLDNLPDIAQNKEG